MREDTGGVVSAARALDPEAAGPDSGTRPGLSEPAWGLDLQTAQLRLVTAATEARRLRRREEWSWLVVASLAVESASAAAVAVLAHGRGMTALAIVAVAWFAGQVAGTSLGSRGRRRASLADTVRRAQVASVGLLVLLACGLVPRQGAAWFLGLAATSLAVRQAVILVQRRRGTTERTMVVGRAADLPAALSKFGTTDVSSYCVSDSDPLSRGEQLHSRLLTDAPQRVVVLNGALSGQELRELTWAVEAYDIDLVVTIADGDLGPCRVEPDSDPRVPGIRFVPRRRVLGDGALAVLHQVAAAVLLLLLAPLMLLLAGLVRLDSRGPALFVQQRVGQHGQHFPMVKFRTMHENAEQMLESLLAHNESEGGVLFKMKNDPRITRLGRILRATSLDELPQLFNVLAGQMSLIGPRPALPREVAQYDRVAWRRLAVRPGITGLWQVSGRSNLPFEEAVRLDVEYVDGWSAGREVDIALRTVGAVLRREGAC